MPKYSKERVSTEILLGSILVLIGTVLLLDKLDLVEFHEIAKLWPVSLIGLGIYQLLGTQREITGSVTWDAPAIAGPVRVSRERSSSAA